MPYPNINWGTLITEANSNFRECTWTSASASKCIQHKISGTGENKSVQQESQCRHYASSGVTNNSDSSRGYYIVQAVEMRRVQREKDSNIYSLRLFFFFLILTSSKITQTALPFRRYLCKVILSVFVSFCRFYSYF